MSRGQTSVVESLGATYQRIRSLTERLCAPLNTEDYGVQSMPDASPVKWHLAHTAWFFETFVLSPFLPDYRPFHPRFGFLFNSYYNAVGERLARDNRGLLTRPTVAEIYRYRAHVDEHVRRLLGGADAKRQEQIAPLIVLGLNHEQQHQELLLTDLLHAFACNPLRPAYRPNGSEPEAAPHSSSAPLTWSDYLAEVRWIGHEDDDFAFDNEKPRHRVFVESFQLASRLATCGEYRAFVEDGGYRRPELWLSDGWAASQSGGWVAPLYWEYHEGHWWQMTLAGMVPMRDAEPVCHVSYYEADAFARWSGARLPTEAEWESASLDLPLQGNLLDSDRLRPAALPANANGSCPAQLFGDVWEWTASPYTAYPGYRPAAGALGEYNGKFMCNQMVLRGGSCATPHSHLRRTYRNFFPPDARWQFSGIRLAKGPDR
jgi:ergothioneine biosynthesis protein EgtB